MSKCEEIVGISVDSHGGAHPNIAVYDSFNQFKSFGKERTVIHGFLTRNNPTSIKHEFKAKELKAFSKALYKFLNLKSFLEEKIDIYYLKLRLLIFY